VRQQRDERHLPDVGAFARHVRPVMSAIWGNVSFFQVGRAVLCAPWFGRWLSFGGGQRSARLPESPHHSAQNGHREVLLEHGMPSVADLQHAFVGNGPDGIVCRRAASANDASTSSCAKAWRSAAIFGS